MKREEIDRGVKVDLACFCCFCGDAVAQVVSQKASVRRQGKTGVYLNGGKGRSSKKSERSCLFAKRSAIKPLSSHSTVPRYLKVLEPRLPTW